MAIDPAARTRTIPLPTTWTAVLNATWRLTDPATAPRLPGRAGAGPGGGVSPFQGSCRVLVSLPGAVRPRRAALRLHAAARHQHARRGPDAAGGGPHRARPAAVSRLLVELRAGAALAARRAAGAVRALTARLARASSRPRRRSRTSGLRDRPPWRVRAPRARRLAGHRRGDVVPGRPAYVSG